MCHLVAHISDGNVVPFILRSLELQEPYAGAFFCGVGVIDGKSGRIALGKNMGGVARVARLENIRRMSGRAGIGHTRPDMMGDGRWAQPFISCDGKFLVAANGGLGPRGKKFGFEKALKRLLAGGHRVPSLSSEYVDGEVFRGPLGAHTTEIMTHLCEEHLGKAKDPVEAIRGLFRQVPTEIAMLMLHADYPDRVFAAKWNQPLYAGLDGKGSYISTMAEGLPKGCAWKINIPYNSITVLTRNGVEFHPIFDIGQTPRQQFTPGEIKAAVTAALNKTPGMNVKETIDAATARLLKRSGARHWTLRYEAFYDAARALASEGKIARKTARVRGRGFVTRRHVFLPGGK